MKLAPRFCPVCGVEIPRRFLMCRDDWQLVPYGLRRRVLAHWQAFSGGVGGAWRPYTIAAKEAIDAARKKRGPVTRAPLASDKQLALL